MSPRVRTFAWFSARITASMSATDAELSNTPGARRVPPSVFTVTSASIGCTVSMCAANTRVGPPPAPRRRPVTLPMESVDTSSPAARICPAT